MRAVASWRVDMRGQLTITGAIARLWRIADMRLRALVIIVTGIFALPAAASEPGILTTALKPTPQAAPAPAATLTTVIVDGSTVYSPPQLFSAYRDQLGRPYSREVTRAIANALADLYVRDGFVKPE